MTARPADAPKAPAVCLICLGVGTILTDIGPGFSATVPCPACTGLAPSPPAPTDPEEPRE